MNKTGELVAGENTSIHLLSVHSFIHVGTFIFFHFIHTTCIYGAVHFTKSN